MKLKHHSILLFLGFLLIPLIHYAQEEDDMREEESAAVSLEEYSDAFQENFFEALKQKGIENYDRAINLFLKCKQLDADNVVVDHELAKVYLADKQYLQAKDYGITALLSEPENLWYLNTLVDILQKQRSTVETIKEEIPYDNNALKENLALIYYRKGQYQNALNILKSIKKSDFSDALTAKINDSLQQQAQNKKTISVTVRNTASSDPLDRYKTRIQVL